ncbi:neurotrophin 1-like isoform X1 [Homarus americanus]|uniref:neurotrophin 1-like isoform X1 n=1 Tax=Homarus americanus TaxID=6706 RepID=UPI001C4970B6|nr:neurotrophin 1-like isoform X1 [Homarus americanus]
MVLVVVMIAACVVVTQGDPEASTPKYDPPVYPRPRQADALSDHTTDDEVKKDREPLLRSSKILPFLPERYLGSLGVIPGPVGVSLGLGVPVASPPIPDVLHNPLVPGNVRGPRPVCAGSGTYCLYDNNYPLDKVNAISDRFYNDIRHIYSNLYRFHTNDIVYYDNATLHYRNDGHFVCESSVQYVRPGWAQNVRGEWLAILNTDKFPQTIRTEICRYGGKRCEYLPPCYKSRCAQRFSYVRLLCVDPYHPSIKPVVDVFPIPTACSCFVEDFTYY